MFLANLEGIDSVIIISIALQIQTEIHFEQIFIQGDPKSNISSKIFFISIYFLIWESNKIQFKHYEFPCSF